MSNDSSAQPCGCDPGAQWICDMHRREGIVAYQEATVKMPCSYPAKVATVSMGPNRATTLPTDSAGRKTYPVASGVLNYFPDALAAVSHVSYVGNEQHNPGQPLHWSREKSADHDDTMMRHFLERGKLDTDGQRHSAKMVWRALAILQLEIEQEGQ